MSYTHGIKWNEALIEKELNILVAKFNLNVFPSVKKLNNLIGNHSLSNAICRKGGIRYWAEKIKLPIGRCETFFGQKYEEKCFEYLKSIGYEVERMSTRFPYDLSVNKHIKIDVKAGRLYSCLKTGSFYTFNLEKKNPTCDIFVCYCINKEEEIVKTYIIPSKKMYGKKQLSVGEKSSVYDNYKNNWNIIKVYDDFYKHII